MNDTEDRRTIKEEFLGTLKNYISDSGKQLTMWNEVQKNYSKSNRHYHNLVHLNSMFTELKIQKNKFSNWDTIIFAIVYHDFVYNTLKSNNEQRSAEAAVKRLFNISFPDKLTAFCRHLILSTKKHELSDMETNLFTDADLSILGSESETYKLYSKQIRREYSIYPDIVYNPGRKKALTHFLKMDNIYKTKEFSDRYELNARTNIQTEINSFDK
jgi:predicted metal-dependent HD superfamily phosphohydrolase